MRKAKYENNINSWISYTSNEDNISELRKRIAIKTQLAKQAKEVAKEVREVTNRMNSESKKMIFQAKVQSILNMYQQTNKESKEIANLLKIELPFVEKVLKQYVQKK